MLFSSVPFLFYFLPAALLIYFAAPRQLKNAVLLLAKPLFLCRGEPKYMLLMLVSIVQGYGFGLLIEKHHGQKGVEGLSDALDPCEPWASRLF